MSTLHGSRNRSLVLTLAEDKNGQVLFTADLYVGCSLSSSVYKTRSAMLGWLSSVDAAAHPAAAQVMDQLLASNTIPLRTVQLSMLPAPARA